jgi:hypothetical protein
MTQCTKGYLNHAGAILSGLKSSRAPENAQLSEFVTTCRSAVVSAVRPRGPDVLDLDHPEWPPLWKELHHMGEYLPDPLKHQYEQNLSALERTITAYPSVDVGPADVTTGCRWFLDYLRGLLEESGNQRRFRNSGDAGS